MRKLIYAPIIHNLVDSQITKFQLKNNHYLIEIFKIVESFWDIVEKELNITLLDYDLKTARVYNDSLLFGSECPSLVVILDDLAVKGSRNCQLLISLIKREGKLEKTEDEYLLYIPKHILNELKRNKFEPEFIWKLRRKITLEICLFFRSALDRKDNLDIRDRYVADQIDKTLLEGEIGILFMGAAHDVPKYLPIDIQVIRLPYSDESAKRLTELIKIMLEKNQ